MRMILAAAVLAALAAHVAHCGVFGTHQGRIGKRMSSLWS